LEIQIKANQHTEVLLLFSQFKKMIIQMLMEVKPFKAMIDITEPCQWFHLNSPKCSCPLV